MLIDIVGLFSVRVGVTNSILGKEGQENLEKLGSISMIRVIYIIAGCSGFGGERVIREFSFECSICTVGSG